MTIKVPDFTLTHQEILDLIIEHNIVSRNKEHCFYKGEACALMFLNGSHCFVFATDNDQYSFKPFQEIAQDVTFSEVFISEMKDIRKNLFISEVKELIKDL